MLFGVKGSSFLQGEPYVQGAPLVNTNQTDHCLCQPLNPVRNPRTSIVYYSLLCLQYMSAYHEVIIYHSVPQYTVTFN